MKTSPYQLQWREALEWKRQSALLDRIFETSLDTMLCKLPNSEQESPVVLRSSPGIYSMLGLDEGADLFSAFTVEQQTGLGEAMAYLRVSCSFSERMMTLAHNSTIVACSGHMVDQTRFLLTMRDVTEAKRAEVVERERQQLTVQAAANEQRELAMAEKEAAVTEKEAAMIEQEAAIAEKERAWAESERAGAELRQLIETANAPIFGVDVTGKVNEWNKKAEDITGYAKAEVLGADLVASFIAPEQKEAVQAVLSRALASEETSNYELPLYTKSNERVEVLLNATTRRDASGEVVGVVGIGQEVTEMKRAHMEERKQALALERISDVILELHLEAWTPEAVMRAVILHATPSFSTMFGVSANATPGAWPSLCSEPSALSNLLSTKSPSHHAELRFGRRTIRVSSGFAPDLTGDNVLLVVCHDLTDFKERVELEKDRQLISTLQHEEKNAHQAQELDADRVSAMLLELESKLCKQRDIAHEYHPDWVDFYSAHLDSCRTLKQAHVVLGDIVDRAQSAQRQAHNRIMLRQLAHDDYVPARSPIDVMEKLHEQLGHASPVELRVVGARMDQTVRH